MTSSASHLTRRGLSHIDTWVFDLDDTLYPQHLKIGHQLDERVRSFVASFLGLSYADACTLQEELYKRYGTTMQGLMTEYGMKPDEYLEFIHQVDHSPLEPNPALGAAIEKLPGRKFILTNGTRKHAEAVMRRLAIHQHFDDVFDIVAAELEPKPSEQTYKRFLARHGVNATKTAIFEDRPGNLVAPHALGMTTVLVVPEVAQPILHNDLTFKTKDALHIDYLTEDLVRFLDAISSGR